MKKRVLYVEDDPNNMLLVRRILQADGHEMLEATDGESGWDVAVRERPDFILMDIHLPGPVNGLELTRRLKADPSLAAIPVVALTAYADEETAAREAGCEGFLHKPADIRQIRATMRQFLSIAEV
jgi:two-component system cell cycle response regulator DivK